MTSKRNLNHFWYFKQDSRTESLVSLTHPLSSTFNKNGCYIFQNKKTVMTDTICTSIFPILELLQLTQFHQASNFFCSSTEILNGSFNKSMANTGQLHRHLMPQSKAQCSGAETVQKPISGTARSAWVYSSRLTIYPVHLKIYSAWLKTDNCISIFQQKSSWKLRVSESEPPWFTYMFLLQNTLSPTCQPNCT